MALLQKLECCLMAKVLPNGLRCKFFGILGTVLGYYKIYKNIGIK